MPTPTSRSISKLKERDIDLLLLEELQLNPAVRAAFRRAAKLPAEEDSYVGAWHSIHLAGLGETDLAFQFVSGGKAVLLLIENKIDAPFTPGQPERYRLRAQERLRQDLCDVCEVLLVAPERYLRGVTAFANVLSYETICEAMEASVGDDPRTDYRIGLLRQASQGRLPGSRYTPASQASLQVPVSFDQSNYAWSLYDFCATHYPALAARKPIGAGAKGAWFFYFNPIDLPLLSGQSLMYKAHFGRVELQLMGFGGRQVAGIEALSQKHDTGLPTGTHFEAVGKTSISLVIDVPPTYVNRDFDPQLPDVQTGLVRLFELYTWLKVSFDFEWAKTLAQGAASS